MPEFSIITVTYNAVATIEKSILSVLDQKNSDFEYIIIDGQSTDGTLDIITKYIANITHFVSEKDHGIYDAMNKGVNLSTGKYLFFLGADDFFYEDTTCFKVSEIILNKTYDIILGNIIYDHGQVIKPKFSYKLLLHNSIHHQGTFYNRNLFADFKYETSLKLISDYELNLILFLKKKNIRHLKIDSIISLCSANGLSQKMVDVFIKETNQIRSRHLRKNSAKLFKLVFFLKLKIWNALRHK